MIFMALTLQTVSLIPYLALGRKWIGDKVMMCPPLTEKEETTLMHCSAVYNQRVNGTSKLLLKQMFLHCPALP